MEDVSGTAAGTAPGTEPVGLRCPICGHSPYNGAHRICADCGSIDDAAAFCTWLMVENGYLAARPILGRRYVAIRRLIFTYALLIGNLGDTTGYNKQYCYDTRFEATTAFAAWDGRGEPQGWHREATSGRRRPDGDATREYVGR